MRSLITKPNTNTSDSDYPYGRIRNNDGSGNGTPVTEQVYGDFHQFFQKMMDDGKVAPNELPENAYSGFQLNQALANLIKGPETAWFNIPNDLTTYAYQNSWVNASDQGGHTSDEVGSYKIDKSGFVCLRGIIRAGASASIAFTLKPGYRPTKVEYFPVCDASDNTIAAVASIAINGDVTITGSGSDDWMISLCGIRFALD